MVALERLRGAVLHKLHLPRFTHPTRAAALHATVRLRDGTPVRLRAIRSNDKQRLCAAFEGLSPRSVYQRFLHPVTALTPDVLRRLTELDFQNHVGLVLSVEEGGSERLIAVGEYVRVADHSQRAEFAITVADAFQHRGAGTLLLQHLVDIARASGILELVADVLEDNQAMLDVIHATGLPCQKRTEGGVCRVVMRLADAGAVMPADHFHVAKAQRSAEHFGPHEA